MPELWGKALMDAGLLCHLSGYVLVHRATFLDRVAYWQMGWRFLGWGKRTGWSGVMPLYERNGEVSHPQGYGERLETQNSSN